LTIEDYCEPIIDEQTWQAVQAIVEEQSQNKNNKTVHHPRRVSSKFLLSGIAYCARCRSPLYGHSSSQRTKTPIERYACTRATRRRDCGFKPIPRKVFEEAVIDKLVKEVLIPQVISQQYNVMKAQHHKQQKQIEAQCQSLAKKLTIVRRRIANLSNAIAETGHTRTLLDALTEEEKTETALVAQIAELDRQQETPVKIKAEKIPEMAENLRQKLLSGDPKAVKTALRGIIKRIEVDRINGNEIVGEIIVYHPP
jgi:site-specific DNA recombinase